MWLCMPYLNVNFSQDFEVNILNRHAITLDFVIAILLDIKDKIAALLLIAIQLSIGVHAVQSDRFWWRSSIFWSTRLFWYTIPTCVAPIYLTFICTFSLSCLHVISVFMFASKTFLLRAVWFSIAYPCSTFNGAEVRLCVKFTGFDFSAFPFQPASKFISFQYITSTFLHHRLSSQGSYFPPDLVFPLQLEPVCPTTFWLKSSRAILAHVLKMTSGSPIVLASLFQPPVSSLLLTLKLFQQFSTWGSLGTVILLRFLLSGSAWFQRQCFWIGSLITYTHKNSSSHNKAFIVDSILSVQEPLLIYLFLLSLGSWPITGLLNSQALSALASQLNIPLNMEMSDDDWYFCWNFTFCFQAWASRQNLAKQ